MSTFSRNLRRAAALALALAGASPSAAWSQTSPQGVAPAPSAQGTTPGSAAFPFGGSAGSGLAGDNALRIGPDGSMLGGPAGNAGAPGGDVSPFSGLGGEGGGAGFGAGPVPGGGADGAGAGAGGAGGAGSGVSPGLGGTASVAGAPPGVIGDYQPFTSFRPALASSRFPNLPTPLPPGGVTPGRNDTAFARSAIIYKLAGIKTADNQSPRPQDRIYYSFNYFDDANASINRRLGAPFSNVQLYHQLFGFEKTVLNGRGSLGLRMPLDTISQTPTTNNPIARSLAGSKTAVGDLSIIGKYALYDSGRNFFSLGLQVTAPTGPGGFAGNKYYSYFRDTEIQPFVGYIFTRDRFYLQGFSAINVPTNSQDVTLLFNDLSLGYFAYRSEDLRQFLTAIVPVTEVHVSTPLNHRYFNPNDIATTPDVVNLTFGVNTRFGARTYLSAAYVTPVTGPKPFNAELALQLNIRFGGNFRNQPANFPVIGN